MPQLAVIVVVLSSAAILIGMFSVFALDQRSKIPSLTEWMEEENPIPSTSSPSGDSSNNIGDDSDADKPHHSPNDVISGEGVTVDKFREEISQP